MQNVIQRPMMALSSMSVVISVLLSGCLSMVPMAQPKMEAPIQEKIATAKEPVKPSIVLRAGDTFANTFRSMGMLDGFTYILNEDATRTLTGNSVPVYSNADLINYFSAHDISVLLSQKSNTKYIKVKFQKNDSIAKAKANNNCKVTLAGTVPMGQVLMSIANKAKIDVNYADTGASSYSGVMFSVGYKGTCASALEYMGRKADLTSSFTDTAVDFRMMDTATVDIGIPLRDRKIALDILADGNIAGTASSGGSSSGASGGSKSMQSSYATNYLSSVKSLLDSTRTSFGTWNYIPETGQIFIRDRAEAVAATKSNLNRMAQAFYGRFEVTLTFYRMTSNKNSQVSGSMARIINENLAFAFGSPAELAKKTASINFKQLSSAGLGTNVVQLLSEFGSIETLDTFSLTLQAGVPQTLKVANNTEYVRNVSSTSSGTSGGSSTSTIEQANATDGAFVTIQARQAEIGKIAVDFGAFINRLDGFDTTETQSSTVKSQRGFERTFDSMAVVDDGIPYVASIVSQKTNTDATATLPGLESLQGLASYIAPAVAGSKTGTTAQTYIVVMVEARKQ